jgi:hypothetical protein
VDGKKYFDREEDDDDMRLEVNPEENFEETYTRWYESGKDEDSCLRGAELLFDSEGMSINGGTE